MDQQQRYGCMAVIGVVISLIISLFVGGQWRTEINYIPDLHQQATGEFSFAETATARHWLGGLVQGTQPDLQGELSKYVREGETVTQLSIVTRHTVLDWIVTGITLGIYSPVTVDIRGKAGTLAHASRSSATEYVLSRVGPSDKDSFWMPHQRNTRRK